MSAKQIISAKVRQNTLEELEQYRERHDLSRSDAIRDLLEEGLENVQNTSQGPWSLELLTVVGGVLAALSVFALLLWLLTPLLQSGLFVLALALATVLMNGLAYAWEQGLWNRSPH